MCTVSVIASGDAWRLVCNRDEQRTRGAARPPVMDVVAGVRVVMPRDADKGGTWIGINEHGVAAVLLNRTGPGVAARREGSPTRGGLVPATLRGETVEAGLDAARVLLSTRAFPGFRLLIVSAEGGGVSYAVLREDGAAVRGIVPGAIVWSSSGLGDALVEEPRRGLFVDMVVKDPTATSQDAFHGHRWEGRGAESVDMEREDARTVSVTTIEAGWTSDARAAVMRYVDRVSGAAHEARLGLRAGS
jgi:hypothetical protein